MPLIMFGKRLGQSANYTLLELYTYSESFRESIFKSLKDSSGLGDEAFAKYADLTDLVNDKQNILNKLDAKGKQKVETTFEIIDEIVNGGNNGIGSWKVVSFVDNDTINVAGQAGRLVNGEWKTTSQFRNSGDGLAAVAFETDSDNKVKFLL